MACPILGLPSGLRAPRTVERFSLANILALMHALPARLTVKSPRRGPHYRCARCTDVHGTLNVVCAECIGPSVAACVQRTVVTRAAASLRARAVAACHQSARWCAVCAAHTTWAESLTMMLARCVEASCPSARRALALISRMALLSA